MNRRTLDFISGLKIISKVTERKRSHGVLIHVFACFMQMRETQTDYEIYHKTITLCIYYKFKDIKHDHQHNVLGT